MPFNGVHPPRLLSSRGSLTIRPPSPVIAGWLSGSLGQGTLAHRHKGKVKNPRQKVNRDSICLMIAYAFPAIFHSHAGGIPAYACVGDKDDSC